MSTRGMQFIIDNAAGIEISRNKTIGQLVVRSGRIRTAERASVTPWQLIVTPPTCRYEDVRDVIEGITVTDRNRFFYIDFENNPAISWISEYRGDLTQAQQDNLTVSTASGFLGNATFDTESIFNYVGATNTSTFDYMRLTGLPAIGATGAHGTITSSSYVFKAGDWIQFRTSADPWGQYSNYVADRGLPRTVPLDVLRGTGTTVDVPVHRPFVFTSTATYSNNGRAGADISIGKYVRMRFVLTKMPSYKILPGKIVQWTGDFELYEYIE